MPAAKWTGLKRKGTNIKIARKCIWKKKKRYENKKKACERSEKQDPWITLLHKADYVTVVTHLWRVEVYVVVFWRVKWRLFKTWAGCVNNLPIAFHGVFYVVHCFTQAYLRFWYTSLFLRALSQDPARIIPSFAIRLHGCVCCARLWSSGATALASRHYGRL